MEAVNKLILGDNLEILKQLESETVDLIYLDPPFFSNRTYEIIWGDSGGIGRVECVNVLVKKAYLIQKI